MNNDFIKNKFPEEPNGPWKKITAEELKSLITGQTEVKATSIQKEGLKYDGEKPSLSLIPSSLLLEVGKVLTYGAKKYAAHNWRLGILDSRLISAALRHIIAYNEGEDIDQESKLHHLAHAICELAFAMEQNLDPNLDPKLDDRYKGN